MLRLLSYFLGLLIFPSVQGGIGLNSKDQSSCVLQDAPQQCGSFCLATLNPLFEGLQAGLDSRFKLAEEQHMAVKSEMKNQLQELITKEDFANLIQAQDARFDRMEALMKIKITADANDELKSQVNSLKDTIKDLQSQLKISEGQTKSKEDILRLKEELIKSKEDILKAKEKEIKSQHEQNSDLRNKIKALEKTKSELSSQLSELRKTDDNLPDSCPNDSPNGIYQIKVRGLEPFKVSCATSPPGWTVIQRRIDGSEDFRRTWNDYKSGFGNVSREFFIGLEKLHRMTEARPHELYIKVGSVNGSTSHAQYDDFKIGSEEELYELKNLGKYSGEAGDSLTFNKNQKFSTFDRDNDSDRYRNCADKFGAWWHNECSESSLNGKYFKDGRGWGGILWYSWHKDWDVSLTFVEMMIRPKFL